MVVTWVWTQKIKREEGSMHLFRSNCFIFFSSKKEKKELKKLCNENFGDNTTELRKACTTCQYPHYWTFFIYIIFSMAQILHLSKTASEYMGLLLSVQLIIPWPLGWIEKGGFWGHFWISLYNHVFFLGHTHKNHYVKVSATFIYTSSLRKAPEVLPFSFECGN